MPHALGQCAGWHPGIYTRDQCRSCWATKNAPTCRMPAMLAPIDPPTRNHLPDAGNMIRPPCVHLGPLQSACPLGDTLRDVRHCLCDDTDAGRCWRSAIPSTDADVASCERCPHFAPIVAAGVAIAITEWNRPAQLARLLDSIQRHMPGYPVEVEDTKGNLSAGRNRLYGRVPTPYLLMMEEDFVVRSTTAEAVANAVAILEHDARVWGVGGIANEPHPGKPPPGQQAVRSRGMVRWGHNFARRGDVVHIVPSVRPMRVTPGGVRYRPCDIVLNFGVFRTQLFRDVPYDNALPIHEHKEYFWRACQTGKEFAFLSSLIVDHIRDHPTAEWRAARRRSFVGRVRQKHGFVFDREV